MKPCLNKFSVIVLAKPYVSRFIEINYGLPLDLAYYPETNKHFYHLLKKQNTLYDKKYPDKIKNYTSEIEILISERQFYRYGWELTKTDTIAFGKLFEIRIKALMRIAVGYNIAMGFPISVCIKRFQEKYGFTEDIWPYESIKKDFYRKGHTITLGFETEIFSKLDNLILLNLYDSGTISSKFLKEYVTN